MGLSWKALTQQPGDIKSYRSHVGGTSDFMWLSIFRKARLSIKPQLKDVIDLFKDHARNRFRVLINKSRGSSSHFIYLILNIRVSVIYPII